MCVGACVCVCTCVRECVRVRACVRVRVHSRLSTDMQVAYKTSGDKQCPPYIDKWLKGDRQPALSFIESTLQKLRPRDGFHEAQFQGSTLQTTLVAFRQASEAGE